MNLHIYLYNFVRKKAQAGTVKSLAHGHTVVCGKLGLLICQVCNSKAYSPNHSPYNIHI